MTTNSKPLLIGAAVLGSALGLLAQGAAAFAVVEQLTPATGTLSSAAVVLQARSATTGVVLVNTLTGQGEGAGTGMVIDASGLVLTNYHVVQGSTAVRVTVPDSLASYDATVVGHDASKDVALLQLQGAPTLQTVRVDTEGTAVGDSVTAIGNGEGAGVLQSQRGTITGDGQSITVNDESAASGQEHLSGLLETDAAIVPGYSGGPLFDAQAEVVGMNTAGSTTGRVVDAYAVPIGDALAVVDIIRAGASEGTTRVGPAGALGITVASTQVSTRSRFAGIGSAATGVRVVDVLPGSGAASAGLTSGSTITAVDSSPVGATADLSSAMANHAPGDTVQVSWTDAAGAAHQTAVTLQPSTVN